MCKYANVRIGSETYFLQRRVDVQMCRHENVQMAKKNICTSAHPKICILLAVSVDDIQYHLVFLQLRQIIKQDIMLFRVRS